MPERVKTESRTPCGFGPGNRTGPVHHEQSQNALVTTAKTITIIRTVGTSFTIR